MLDLIKSRLLELLLEILDLATGKLFQPPPGNHQSDIGPMNAEMPQKTRQQRPQMSTSLSLLDSPPVPPIPSTWQPRTNERFHTHDKPAPSAPQFAPRGHGVEPPLNPFTMQGQEHTNPVQQQQAQERERLFAENGNDPVSFDIDKKSTASSKVFAGKQDDYEMWYDRMMHHIGSENSLWRAILALVKVQPRYIKKAQCLPLHCAGFNAWTSAEKLDNFPVKFISDSSCRKRTSVSGGELGNGVELWRKIFHEYKGGRDTIRTTGIGATHAFPQCQKVSGLGPHLGAWEDLIKESGEELHHAPQNLMSMIKERLTQ